MNQSECLIVNAYHGSGWYHRGADRLMGSLLAHGWKEFIQWRGVRINSIFNPECPYTIKAAALHEASRRNVKYLLWLDCSMWAIRNPLPLFEVIDSSGVYVETNGYNCAQECNDSILDYYGISRDAAEKMPMCSSGFIGINLQSLVGRLFIDNFIAAANAGVFCGSREHSGQSNDPRFLHHRQDQSAASLILNSLKVEMKPLGTHFSYYPNLYGTNQNENTYFLCQGM